MVRRFTVIQGDLGEPAQGAKPGRARLEAVGAALRQRLAALRAEAAPSPPTIFAPTRRLIPDGALIGVRPEGWRSDVAA